VRWKAHQGRIDPSRLVFIDAPWVLDGPINGELFLI